MPVCRQGTPCSEPAIGAQLVFTQQNGSVAARVTAAEDGSYSVSLAPGTYGVAVTGQPSIGRGIEPSTVRVVAESRRTRDFTIDTGIR